MAAYNIDNELRVFLLDRDSTVIDDENKPINPDKMYLLLQEIIRNSETCAWGILSTGSSGFVRQDDEEQGNDSKLKEFSEQIVDPQAKHWAYPRLGFYLYASPAGGRGMLGNTLAQRDGNNPANKWVETMKKNMDSVNMSWFDMLAFGKVEEDESGGFSLEGEKKNPKYGEANEPELLTEKISISKEATLTLNFHEMKVVLDMQQFIKNRAYHTQGDNKIFQGLAMMAQAGIAVEVNAGMVALGINHISAPDNFKWIKADQVCVIDDRANVMLALQKAGFNAHLADSVHAIIAKSTSRERDLNNILQLADQHPYLKNELQSIFNGAMDLFNSTKADNAYIEKWAQHLGFDSYQNFKGFNADKLSEQKKAVFTIIQDYSNFISVEKVDSKRNTLIGGVSSFFESISGEELVKGKLIKLRDKINEASTPNDISRIIQDEYKAAVPGAYKDILDKMECALKPQEKANSQSNGISFRSLAKK